MVNTVVIVVIVIVVVLVDIVVGYFLLVVITVCCCGVCCWLTGNRFSFSLSLFFRFLFFSPHIFDTNKFFHYQISTKTMVLSKILPSQGGGGIRRFLRLRSTIYSDYFRTVIPKKATDTPNNFSQSDHNTPQMEEDGFTPSMSEYRHKYMKPLVLFDFKNKDDAMDALSATDKKFEMLKGGWRLSDDEVIGGFSRGGLDLMGNYQDDESDHANDDDNTKNTNNINDCNDNDRNNDNDNNDSENNENNYDNKNDINYDNEEVEQPYIRWSGNIDTKIGPQSRAKRSGFCAIRCPEIPFGIPLGSMYNALELNCRTDGRIYTVNLKADTYFPDDLYQALITVDDDSMTNLIVKNDDDDDAGNDDSKGLLSFQKNEFLTLILPFADFLLTSEGLVREQQRKLDGGIHLEQLGITLMDGSDGPFQFDLARIRAVNYLDGEIVGDDE